MTLLQQALAFPLRDFMSLTSPTEGFASPTKEKLGVSSYILYLSHVSLGEGGVILEIEMQMILVLWTKRIDK